MENSNRQTGPISVVGICGSIRKSSYTRLAVEAALDGAKEMKVETNLINLKE